MINGPGIINNEPLFYDHDNHMFLLAAQSPCIDAGNPNSDFYDIYDSARPGYALFPAKGRVRNDMGAYGGGSREQAVSDPDYLPTVLALKQNYPNPFNSFTTITFQVPARSKVSLDIYNLLGQHIQTLFSQTVDAGSYRMLWEGKNRNGRQAASGIYFVLLRSGAQLRAMKIALIR